MSYKYSRPIEFFNLLASNSASSKRSTYDKAFGFWTGDLFIDEGMATCRQRVKPQPMCKDHCNISHQCMASYTTPTRRDSFTVTKSLGTASHCSTAVMSWMGSNKDGHLRTMPAIRTLCFIQVCMPPLFNIRLIYYKSPRLHNRILQIL